MFLGQNKPKVGFRTLYFPAIRKKFRREDTFYLQTIFACCIHISIHVGKRASPQAGGELFS